MSEDKKTPDPIDIRAGSRVRLRRTMMGLSQEKPGDSLGVPFQQIQMSEKGTNLLVVCGLQNIAVVLNMPVAFFFEDAPQSADRTSGEQMNESKSPNYIVVYCPVQKASSEGLQLNRPSCRLMILIFAAK